MVFESLLRWPSRRGHCAQPALPITADSGPSGFRICGPSQNRICQFLHGGHQTQMRPTRKVGDRNKAFCSNTALADQLVSPRSVKSHPTLPNLLQTQTTKSAPRSLRSCRSVRAPPPSLYACTLQVSSHLLAPQVSSNFLQHHHRPIRPRAVQWAQVLRNHQAHRSIAPTQAAAGEHQAGRAASLPCSSSLRSDSSNTLAKEFCLQATRQDLGIH